MNYDVTDFQKEVIEKSNEIPVLVDFWAEWCAPCRILGPVLEKLAQESNGKWQLAKLNTDKFQQIAAEYGVRGIPNVKLFWKGKVINEFTGALPEYMIKDWLKKSLPSKYEDKIELAKMLIENNEEDKAKKVLKNVLENEPDNDEVKLLLAKLTLFENPSEAEKLVENVDGTVDNIELAESIQTLGQFLNKLNNPDSLPENEVKEKYVSAIDDLKNKNFDSALEKFIDVIKTDRQYDNDGARKACIAIFKYLGEDNEITLKHRREFGSALYI